MRGYLKILNMLKIFLKILLHKYASYEVKFFCFSPENFQIFFALVWGSYHLLYGKILGFILKTKKFY